MEFHRRDISRPGKPQVELFLEGILQGDEIGAVELAIHVDIGGAQLFRSRILAALYEGLDLVDIGLVEKAIGIEITRRKPDGNPIFIARNSGG